jgi:hypothetical protein
MLNHGYFKNFKNELARDRPVYRVHFVQAQTRNLSTRKWRDEGMKALKKLVERLMGWFFHKPDLDFKMFQKLESKKYQKRGGSYED